MPLLEALPQPKMSVPMLNPMFTPRQEVLQRLQNGLQGRLTTVVAGPGYGKTMHLAWFVRHTDSPVAWLQVTEEDADPSRFLASVLQAIFPARPGSELSIRPLFPEAVIAEVVIAARTRGSLILVLDDLQAAPGGFAARFVVQLAQSAPPELHLFVAARPSLALPLGRLRLTDGLTEISQTDLVLGDDEAAALLAKAAGGAPPTGQIRRTVALAAGWGAGLKLLGAALGRDSGMNLTGPSLPDDLNRYLLEEAWGGLSPGEQRLLEDTCLVRNTTAELAAELMGKGAWRKSLERLKRDYGILVSASGGAYGLHPLWDIFLRERLTHEAGADGMASRARTAASVLAARGQLLGAARLYLEAGDFRSAAGLLKAEALVWSYPAAPPTLMGTPHTMRLHHLEELPWLALWAAQADFAGGRLEEARVRSEIAAAGFEREQDRAGQALTAVLRCAVALLADDVPLARTLVEDGFRVLTPEMDLVRARLLEQRWQVLATEQTPEWEGQERLLQEALHLYQRAPSPQTEHEARVVDRLGCLAVLRGRVDQGITLLDRAVSLFREIGSPPWETGYNLGAALSGACRFTEALEFYEPMFERSERPMRRLIAGLNLMDIYTTLGEFGKTLAASRGVLELVDSLNPPRLGVRARVELSRLYRLQGEIDLSMSEARAAASWAARGAGCPGEGEARRALAEAGLWSQSRWAGPLDGQFAGTPEWARTAAVSAVYLLRNRKRSVREGGADLLRRALRALSQQGAFRGFVLRHWDLALVFAVTGLATGVLSAVCHEILSTLEEVPESVRRRGIRIPEPETRYLREVAGRLDEQGMALLDRLLPADQRLHEQQSATSVFRARLLDRLSLRLNGEPFDSRMLGKRKALALLLTLLMMPAGVERPTLIEWLWPEADRSTGQSNLRVSLHYLRHLLEPDRPSDSPSVFIGSDGGKLVWLSETTRVDVWEIQRHLRSAARAVQRRDHAAAAQSLEEAVSWYRGPLVTDGCMWLEGLGASLHREVLRAHGWLANLYRTNRPERAIEHLEKLLELEPGDEPAARDLMLLLAGAGRRVEVARVYHQCAAYLSDLGISVSPATTAVYQEAAGVASPAARQP